MRNRTIVLCLLGSALCQSPAHFRIRGTVVDTSGGAITNAVVRIEQWIEPNAQTPRLKLISEMRTNEKGSFSVELPNGSYEIYANAPHFEGAGKKLAVGQYGDRSIQIVLQRDPYDKFITPSATSDSDRGNVVLSGRIIDFAGALAPGVKVFEKCGKKKKQHCASAVSDSFGRYRLHLNASPQKDVEIWYELRGYQTLKRRERFPASGLYTVDVTLMWDRKGNVME